MTVSIAGRSIYARAVDVAAVALRLDRGNGDSVLAAAAAAEAIEASAAAAEAGVAFAVVEAAVDTAAASSQIQNFLTPLLDTSCARRLLDLSAA